MSEEAEKIVAWLRAGCGWESTVNRRLLADVAAAIERGDHLVWKPEPTIPASEWTKQPNVGH